MQVPASQINLLLIGASGSDKSYLAGLLVEQLVRFDYSVLVLDREGDHRTLAERRGILGVGGKDPLPNAHQLATLIRHRFGSVVVDLSQLGEQEQHDYVVSITPAILAQRAVTGLPHWIFFDEAHTLPIGEGRWADALAAGDKGFCLSTYLPDRLPGSVQAGTDLLVLCAGIGTQEDQVQRYVRDTGCVSAAELAWLLDDERGRALLIDAAGPVAPKPFAVQRRSSGHVRHWHKYIDGQLPERLRFYFTDSDRVSGNLREFHRHLAACAGSSLEAHARRHDFSRWIHEVLQDTDLAESVAATERQLRTGQTSTDGLRDAIRGAIETRYLE